MSHSPRVPKSGQMKVFSAVALSVAKEAAFAAGNLMLENLKRVKKASETTAHDIKLELDVRCQKTIQEILFRQLPITSLLGEEGVAGDQSLPGRWVVDPIDGTVNFAYGIPHACVSIAFQVRWPDVPGPEGNGIRPREDFETVAGVVYDPFLDEMWTAIRGGPSRLNGKKIVVSKRSALSEAVVAMGFAKNENTMGTMLPLFSKLAPRVRKIRVLGAAALSMAWVAAGRMDAYLEYGLRLWDIAAAGLIVEAAGGEFWRRPVEGEHAYEILASNGLLRPQLEKLRRAVQ